MAKKAPKYVYSFGGGKADGTIKLKPLLGGKGANLGEMCSRGFNVPPGFTVTTEVCTEFYDGGRKFPAGLDAQVAAAVKKVEKITGKKFGDKKNPLLMAVRSGARESMPGMMDTILNLGLNDETVEGLKALTGDGRFAFDCYRRFIQMYGDVVMGVQKKNENDPDPFEHVLEEVKEKNGVEDDVDLTEDGLREVVAGYVKLIKKFTKKAFPQDPMQQLWGAVGAVFGSWMNDRAIIYRAKYKIPAEWGTACNVQAMVFGNMGEDSGTGVAFTRDPATGENIFYGEYLVNAQGEDVVAGIRTPQKVQEMQKIKEWNKTYKELEAVRKNLEKEFGDVQDFEFTIEKRRLWLLQTRNGKRTAQAYVKIAHDMVKQKLMTPEHAIRSADPEAIEQLLAPIFDRKAYAAAQKKGLVLTTGLPAGPGAASGTLCFSAEKAEKWAAHGPVVLARIETSPEDLRGMIAAAGILTAKGGVSSHAAVVARQMGKVCVAGAGELEIDYDKGVLSCKGHSIKEGEAVSINGSTGEVLAGRIDTAPSELIQVLIDGKLKPSESDLFKSYDFVMKLADKYRTLGIRTNADQPDQATNAVAFGAEGIGLCRTEHMFFEGDRIDHIRELIMFAGEYAEYKDKLAERPDDATLLGNEYKPAIDHFTGALKKLLPIQQKDFEGLFTAMQGRPVTVRLLDPPLHEFLPNSKDLKSNLAKKLGMKYEQVESICAGLHESNPMLGHRGCRLGVVYPEITEMQARAIFRAALSVAKKAKKAPVPEIMIPLVSFDRELELQLEVVHRVAKEEFKAAKKTLKYLVGTMIEIPRAALTADQVAKHAQFFSFGTNDLTQTTLGMSRDDAGGFLPYYERPDVAIVKSNPFASLDQSGVGQLVQMGADKGRSVKPDMKLGICGEHGGDPSSIDFCHRVGLTYVSCSPFRVPVARLAAAKAALVNGSAPAKKKAAAKKKTAAKKKAAAKK
ncbi:MAG: PEP-utilizing enzyme [Planctomycetota bacterium]|jgi:pyruvate,orthophosphate dikinase|nr:PEP-utilizing enzyme [Planctomycetota bacterium]